MCEERATRRIPINERIRERAELNEQIAKVREAVRELQEALKKNFNPVCK